MDNLLKDIGNRLREIRQENHFTQEQFAEQLGLSMNFYGQIERGHSSISLEKLKLLYDKFDIDLLYLITGDKSHQVQINKFICDCPKEKLFDIEQILRYASNLYK